MPKHFTGRSFFRPHIFERAEGALWDVNQMHLCAFAEGDDE